MKDQWRAGEGGTSAYRRILLVLLHAADLKVPVIYDAVLPMFVSESIKITYDILQFCRLFGSAPYCNQFLTNLFETFKTIQNFSGCFENGRFNRERA